MAGCWMSKTALTPFVRTGPLQEFLAGWHLVKNYAPFNLNKLANFVAKHLLEDQWEEPVRLAAGILADTSEKMVNEFIAKLASTNETRAEHDHAIALAGLCLADIPSRRMVESSLRQELAAQMLAVVGRAQPAHAGEESARSPG